MRRTGFPLDYHAEVLRGFESDDSSALAFVLAVIVAAIGVFLLLQAALRSWKLATATFVSLLAAASGGAVAVLVDGRSITIGTVAGFLGLLAIGTHFMVVLARTIQTAEDDRPAAFGPDLVVDAAGSRLASIAYSAIAVLVVFVPLIVTGADAGLEVVHPMAVVLVGGVLTTTFTSLFVAPGLQLRFGQRPAEGREDLDRDLGAPAPA
jgi:Cu/Ag efflux pump CusA